MIIAKLNPTEEHLLEFSIDVRGTIERVTDVRFVVEGEKYNISFPCKMDGNNVSVSIPKINESFPSGTFDAKLEVLIGDKIFTPLSESVEIMESIKVDITKDIKVKDQVIEVSLKAEGDFEVVEESGHQILKRGDKYHGIIGEGKRLESKLGHSSLEGLLHHLENTKG